MSASYIHRDPLVLSPTTTLQLLSSKNGMINCPNDSFMTSSERSYLDRPVSSSSPSNGTTKPNQSVTQVSLQSPKMSPDSTLTHYHQPSTTTTTPVSRFASNTSPGSSNGLGQCASSCASSSSPSVGDGFLRSALAVSNGNTANPNNGILKINSPVGLNESHTVGSSTGNNLSVLTSMSTTCKVDTNSAAMMAMMMRPRAVTVTSNVARSITPNKNASPPASASSTAVMGSINTPTPSSTTPVKKSSRRNPWGSETYSDLISIAIHSYPDQQATLQQIYDFIISNYEYFRERSDPTSSAGWKNSIRHNLSLHDRFTKCPKSSDNTKSSYWRINAEVASKPYVRRRACSMDGTNLKRSGGNHCGKASSRAGGGSHRAGAHQHPTGDKLGSRLGSVMPPLNEVLDGPILTPLMNPSDAMQQSRPDSQHPNGSRQNSARSAFTKTYLSGANKIPSYFGYPATSISGLNLGKSGQPDQPTGQNGIPGRWAAPKPTHTVFRPSGYPNPSSSAYMYDQASGNFAFDSTDFSSILGSTDQALVRNRASGLIEQLLCSDHSTGAMLSNGKTGPSVQSQQSVASASYLPNSFMPSNPLISSMSMSNGQNPLSDAASNFTPNSVMQHTSAVDLRPSAGSLLSERSNDTRSGHTQHHQLQQQQQQHHHHLRPVPMQNCSSGVDMMSSSTPWNPYTPQFHLPSSMGHGSTMSSSGGGIHSMNYPVFNGNGSFHSQSDSQQMSESKVKYESIETMASGNHNNGSLQQQQRLPFLSGPHMAPVSSSTGNLNSSSAATWSLCTAQHSDIHRIGSVPPCSSGGPLTPLPSVPSPGSTHSTTTVGRESRSLGPPVTPPNPLYYSPMRQPPSGMYGNSDSALDTPPYHQQSQQQTQQSPSIKPDPMDILDSSNLVGTASTVVSSAGTTDYDTSSQTSSTTRHSSYTASCSGGAIVVGLRTRSDADADSEMSTRFADTYPYDDDCEPLELELSLELADRIVGSTRSEAKP